MKKSILTLILSVVALGAFGSTMPMLCPEPTYHDISLTEYVPYSVVNIACPDATAADWAKRHLKQWYGKFAPQVAATSENTSSLGKEAYRLIITPKGATISASTLQGVRYALYTLRQLAIPKRNTERLEGWIVPVATIEDEPHMEFRGVHICWFRENEAWEIERLIRLAAYYKLNYAVIEPWGTYRSKVAPWFGWSEGKMTIKEIKRLKAIADDLGIMLIPQLNVFGHATCSRVGAGKHASLDMHPEYQSYFEPMAGWNWCLSNPHTKTLQKQLIKELYEAFGCPEYFHIGCDEATVPSCPDCIARSYSTLFTEHVKEISSYVKELGAKTLMWHDMLIERNDPRWKGLHAKGTKATASVLNELPKDIVICDWYYRKPRATYPSLEHFKSLGFDVVTCPWENSKGTIAEIKAAHKIGIKGVLGTLWHHYYGESLINSYFYVSSLSWNSNASLAAFGSQRNNRYVFHTHLRHIGWDMKNRRARNTGIYCNEVPIDSHMH